MKVKEIMTREPKVASPATTLAAAGALMLEGDCGILPVVDEAGKLVGVVTDRDMYIALATRDKFFICVEARDALFDAARTRRFLEELPDVSGVYEVEH